MPEFVIDPPARPVLPVVGAGALFPVRRVYCVGRNYAAHAIEMGHDPEREPPFFFQKNPDNLDPSGVFPYPPRSGDVHFEVELAVALKSGGTGIPAAAAISHVWGYGIALDMTRRDLQAQMKKMGRPWEIGKAFERSAPVSALTPAETCGHPSEGRIALSVDGVLRQEGNLDQMIWKVPEMISYLSDYFELGPGDVILTGTPAGVGPIERGQTMTAEVEGLGALEVRVV